MAGKVTLVHTAAEISQLMDTKVRWTSGVWSFRKKRTVKLEDSISGSYCSLNIDVSFYEILDDRSVVNMAVVFLLSEEVPILIAALKQHPSLFPSNYLQEVMMMDQGKCCLQLESLEPAGHFVERLNEALLILEQQIPVITRNH